MDIKHCFFLKYKEDSRFSFYNSCLNITWSTLVNLLPHQIVTKTTKIIRLFGQRWSRQPFSD